MKKRILSAALLTALLLTLAGPVRAASSYTVDASELRGADYTSVPALAAILDRVFRGEVLMYSDARCATLASAPVGSRSVPLGRTYYVRDLKGAVYSGTSCYIYANAVYSTLFGDIPYHGDPGAWSVSRRVAGNLSDASFQKFSDLGVSFGALLRTTPNSDGSYNGNAGHSILILSYDKEGITYLEGNGDGNGIIRVTERSWDTFNALSVSGRGYKISFIVQPTDAYIASLADEGGEADLVGYLALERRYDGRFQDVSPLAWYGPCVQRVFELGLMEGRGEDSFSPLEPVTAGEAVTLCARFLSHYYADGYDLDSGSLWYDGYYDYLDRWGIDTSFAYPFENVTRADFVRLMAQALPEEARGGSIETVFPDVPEEYAGAVRALTRCGVVLGGDGRFWPDGTLTRAEAAAFLGRMADRSLRAG